MNHFYLISLCLIIMLAACSPTPSASPTLTPSLTTVPNTSTPRIRMLPTWTPSPTPSPRATFTPRPTSTPVFTAVPDISFPIDLSAGLLLDRPTYSQLAKPANLVSMQYDPTIWSLITSYPTNYFGYSLTHRSIYNCSLEPAVGRGVEGYQVEHYSRPLGSSTFEIARVSNDGILLFANYCTGDGESYTCYEMTPGDDHDACTAAAEAVLTTFQVILNPLYGHPVSSPNYWLCQDQAGTSGLCQISYSIPLNTLAFIADGQAWAAGDDGVLLHLVASSWSEVASPTTHPIYDLSFSSPSDGWAVGAGAQVLHWDGNSWTEVLPYHGPGEGPAGSTQVLYAVEAVSAKDAWMVGSMKDINGKTTPYALHWDGTDMVEQNAFPDCNCGLNDLLTLAEDDILAVGGSDLGAIAFRWDGLAWSSMLVPGADVLYTLSMSADGSVWAGGLEIARDQSDTRGALFRWDGTAWQRLAVPLLTGGVYALSVLPTGEIVLGGDFTALRSGLDWQPIITSIAAYGWIVDIEVDPQGNVWALTHSGNLFRLEIRP